MCDNLRSLIQKHSLFFIYLLSISVMCQYAHLQCFQDLTLYTSFWVPEFFRVGIGEATPLISYLNLLSANNQFSFNDLDLNLVLTLSFNYSLSPKVFFSFTCPYLMKTSCIFQYCNLSISRLSFLCGKTSELFTKFISF